jgi:hypothetical protein
MQPPRGLIPDAPAPDGECWYRLLTNEDHVTTDGTVHYQALKGRAFQPPREQKPWSHELSGRLASLVTNITADAEAAMERIRHAYIRRGQPIPGKIRFSGVACAVASELRLVIAGIPIDVVYSPLTDDDAHSNVVTYQTASNDVLDPVRHWLMQTLRVIEPQDIEEQIASCGRASA